MVLLGLGFRRSCKLALSCFWRTFYSLVSAMFFPLKLGLVVSWQCNKLQKIWVKMKPFVSGLSLGWFRTVKLTFGFES